MLTPALVLVLLLQIQTLGTTSPVIHYVRTSDVVSCPGQPCLTLHQYTLLNNLTSGTTLMFLPGNHISELTMRLIDVSKITIRGEDNTLQ